LRCNLINARKQNFIPSIFFKCRALIIFSFKNILTLLNDPSGGRGNVSKTIFLRAEYSLIVDLSAAFELWFHPASGKSRFHALILSCSSQIHAASSHNNNRALVSSLLMYMNKKAHCFYSLWKILRAKESPRGIIMSWALHIYALSASFELWCSAAASAPRLCERRERDNHKRAATTLIAAAAYLNYTSIHYLPLHSHYRLHFIYKTLSSNFSLTSANYFACGIFWGKLFIYD